MGRQLVVIIIIIIIIIILLCMLFRVPPAQPVAAQRVGLSPPLHFSIIISITRVTMARIRTVILIVLMIVIIK